MSTLSVGPKVTTLRSRVHTPLTQPARQPKNRMFNESICSSPSEGLFDHDIKVGPLTSSLPNGAVSQLETEEDLEELLPTLRVGRSENECWMCQELEWHSVVYALLAVGKPMYVNPARHMCTCPVAETLGP